MTTLTVDADQITITGPPSGVIVMDGEMQEITEPVTRKIASVSRDNRDVLGGDITVRSALTSMPEQVRRLIEPCQTCDGHPWSLRLICCGHEDEPAPGRTSWDEINAIRNSYIEAEGHDRQAIIVACPDCHNGKPTFTLHQRCGCGGSDACLDRCENGFIDLGDGWTITEVLPMHDGGTKLDTYPPDAFYWTKGEGWWRDSQFDKIVTMPPAAKPGMFVVFAEQETP